MVGWGVKCSFSIDIPFKTDPEPWSLIPLKFQPDPAVKWLHVPKQHNVQVCVCVCLSLLQILKIQNKMKRIYGRGGLTHPQASKKLVSVCKMMAALGVQLLHKQSFRVSWLLQEGLAPNWAHAPLSKEKTFPETAPNRYAVSSQAPPGPPKYPKVRFNASGRLMAHEFSYAQSLELLAPFRLHSSWAHTRGMQGRVEVESQCNKHIE